MMTSNESNPSDIFRTASRYFSPLMWHNPSMTTLQLLRHRRGTGETELSTVENSTNASPVSFRGREDKPFLLGSEELLFIGFALRSEYQIINLVLTDSYGQRLESEHSQMLCADLIEAMNDGNRIVFEDVIDRQMDRIFVVSIELRDKKSPRNGIVSIRRHGVIETNSAAQTTAIESRLRGALV